MRIVIAIFGRFELIHFWHSKSETEKKSRKVLEIFASKDTKIKQLQQEAGILKISVDLHNPV